MTSIQALLLSRNVTLLDTGGAASDLAELSNVWERLWTDFDAYTAIRDHLTSPCDAHLPFFPTSSASAKLLEYLIAAGLLTAHGKTYCFSNPRASQRLRGTWLEEVGATIAIRAGADEVRFSQKISWKSPDDVRPHYNEVDVIARFGKRLSFISCKALAPRATTYGNGPQRIAEALREVARWRKLFGNTASVAILLTTADFIDELRHKLRNAALVERAAALNVQIVSADAGDFGGLLKAFEKVVQWM